MTTALGIGSQGSSRSRVAVPNLDPRTGTVRTMAISGVATVTRHHKIVPPRETATRLRAGMVFGEPDRRHDGDPAT